MLDLIDMDFTEIEKYFALKELIDSMKVFSNCGNGVSELYGSDHFGKKEIYEFIFLATYVGSKYADYGDGWVSINVDFDQEDANL